MKFYTKQHQYYCGIDLHTKSMYICIINQEGTILVHQNLKVEPKSLQKSISPYLPDIVIAAECIFLLAGVFFTPAIALLPDFHNRQWSFYAE